MIDCYLAIKASPKMNDNTAICAKGTKGVEGAEADRQAAPSEIAVRKEEGGGEGTMKRGGDPALSSSRSK